MLLDCSISAQIDAAGRLHKTTRIVTKVMRAQGIEPVQNVTLSWSLARENRPEVNGRVITGDGQAHVLENNGMTEKDPLDPSAAGVIKLLQIVLPDVDIDSVVEMQIQESDREPAFPGGRFGLLRVPTGLPIVHFKATIASASPSDLHVEARSFPGARTTPEATPQGHAVAVEAANIRAAAPLPFLPPDVAPSPSIVFTNVPSWQAIAQWYAGVISKSTAGAAPRAPFSGDQLATVEKIYEDLRKQVQDTSTDLESAAIAPRAAADVLKSGAGDSKDEAALLIGKLAEAGITAKLALISPAPYLDAIPALPGFEAFHHALVYVPGPAPLWIDPAAEYVSVARLPVADQDRWALIIDPATTQLVHIPASTEKDNRQVTETEVRIGDGLPAQVSETIVVFGSFEDGLRPAIAQIATPDEAQKERIISQIFRNNGGQTADSTKTSDAHRLLETCRLQITGQGFNGTYISDDGGFIDLPSIARLNLQRFTALLESAGETGSATARTTGFYIAPRFTTVNSFHVWLPAGYRFKQLPSVPVTNVGPLSITTAIKLDSDGSLRLTYTLIQPKTRMTPQEVNAMRKDAQAISSKASVRIDFENVAMAKIQAGDFATGIKLLRQDAGAAGSAVNPVLRLASGYVLVGARTQALKLCDDLLKRNSGNEAKSGPADARLAAIYGRLGWIYEHDPYGRLLAPGMNAAEAEKNLQQAADLAHDDPSAAIRLADLYSYNAAGVHYGRSARLADAINIYNGLDLNAIARNGKLNDYALLLLHAHKYADLRQFFNYPQADTADQSIKWAQAAASQSEADFRDELQFRFPSVNDRRLVLVLAGRHLISAREYQAAARVFHLAGKGPGVAQADLERLDRVRIFDESTISKQPAIAAFERYIQSVLDPETPADWKKYVPAETSSTLEAQRSAVVQLFHSLLSGAENSGAWPYLSDLINTTLSFTAEGSDATGFRIQASGAANAAPAPVAYVIKQGSTYVVAGLVNSEVASSQAAAQARAGNMQAARQWLDWGREAAGRPKLPEAQFQTELDRVSAELLLSQNKPQEAVGIFERLHEKNPSDPAFTFLLADSLILSNRTAEAKPLIDALRHDANGVLALRLEEHLLAQQQNYAQAAELAKQITAAPGATAADWNELAWVTLFTQKNAEAAKAAATKAAELANFSSPAILHTLAIAQANAFDLKDALGTAYKFASISGDPGEMHTIFGIICENSGVTDAAAQYYQSVPKEEGIRLSNYSFAQLRLQGLASAAQSSTSAAKKEP